MTPVPRPTRVLAPAALVLSLTGAAQAASVGDYPMEPQPVAEGVYAVITPTRELPNPENKGWNSNSAFVITDDGVLVFDTGSSETIGEALRGAIARVTDQPVRWVVVSHGHGDHWLGNAAFAGADVEIITTPEVAERMRTEAQTWIDTFQRMTEGATGDSRIVAPTTVCLLYTSPSPRD